MYAKIEDNIIVSYSKAKMEWWLYTESLNLCSSFAIIECINTETQNNLWEDIYTITCEDPNKDEKEVTTKLLRMKEIRREIIALWYTVELPSDDLIDGIIDAKKEALVAERDTIKAEVYATYDAELIDEIINSLFS